MQPHLSTGPYQRARRTTHLEEHRAYDRAYRRKHKDVINANKRKRNTDGYQRNYRAQHREEINKKQREYKAKKRAEQLEAKRLEYEANKDIIEKEKQARRQEQRARYNAKRRADHAAQREIINAQARAKYPNIRERRRVRRSLWRAANREIINVVARIKRVTNPTLSRLSVMRRRARKRHLPATFSATERTFMLQHFGYACVACGNQEGLFGFTLADDHWIPLASPACPGTVATNMVPLCHGIGGCNNSKSDTDPHLWLVERFGIRKAAKIEKNVHAYFALVGTVPPQQAAADEHRLR